MASGAAVLAAGSIRFAARMAGRRGQVVAQQLVRNLLGHSGALPALPENTLGAQILAGQNPVNIFGEPHKVAARVAALDAFSGHADKNELRRYAEAITERKAKPPQAAAVILSEARRLERLVGDHQEFGSALKMSSIRTALALPNCAGAIR